MGQAVEALAETHGHEIAARFDADRPLTSAAPEDVRASIAIDFSLPGVALDHIRWYCRNGVPAVVGTTGWYGGLPRVREWVHEHDASLLYAPNFSIGVAVLRRAVASVGPLLDRLPDYDAFVHEIHHTKKVDSPSGTAQMLGELLVEHLDRKTHIDPEAQHDRIDPEALHVSSTRTGSVYGEHTVGFDSPYDRISLEHRAKSRHGFAFGALKAAEWLVGRTGLFTLEDVLDDWVGDAG